MTESEEKYGDILNLPHHQSKVHPQMSIYDRAAQFSPFAALTGHEAAIKETARLTEEQVELDEDKQEELNEKLQTLIAQGYFRNSVTMRGQSCWKTEQILNVTGSLKSGGFKKEIEEIFFIMERQSVIM